MTNIVLQQRIADAHTAEPNHSAHAMTIKPEQPADRFVAPPAQAGKIVLPTMEGLCFEKIKHITYLEASGNYTMLHFKDGRQILVCKTLGDVEQLLPESVFVRIHRSHTINLQHIKKYVRGKGGYVLLQSDITLAVSSGQKDHFMESLRRFFKH